jgi:hypothetical protein
MLIRLRDLFVHVGLFEIGTHLYASCDDKEEGQRNSQ